MKVWQVEQLGDVPATAVAWAEPAGGYAWQAEQAAVFVRISIIPSLCVAVASVVGGTEWQSAQVDDVWVYVDTPRVFVAGGLP